MMKKLNFFLLFLFGICSALISSTHARWHHYGYGYPYWHHPSYWYAATAPLVTAAAINASKQPNTVIIKRDSTESSELSDENDNLRTENKALKRKQADLERRLKALEKKAQ